MNTYWRSVRAERSADANDVAVEQDSEQLIALARGGCDVALGKLYQKLNSYLLLVANRQLGDDIKAKLGASDIVQQSLLDARENIANFQGTSEAEFRGWLRKLLVHNLVDGTRRYRNTLCRDIQRERGLDEVLHEATPTIDQTPSWHLCKCETDAELEREMAKLPERQQAILTAHHRDEKTFVEIAAELELTAPTVRKIWSQAIKTLRFALVDPS